MATKRDVQLNIRVSRAEYDNLVSAAGRAGVSTSDYARSKLFGKTRTPAATYQMESELDGLRQAINEAQRVLGEVPRRRRT